VALALDARDDEDPRTPFYTAAVVDDASERLGVDPFQLFTEIPRIRQGRHADIVASVPARRREHGVPSPMRFVTLFDRDGFRYVHRGTILPGAVGENWPF
jgi:hypothetical protein